MSTSICRSHTNWCETWVYTIRQPANSSYWPNSKLAGCSFVIHRSEVFNIYNVASENIPLRKNSIVDIQSFSRVFRGCDEHTAEKWLPVRKAFIQLPPVSSDLHFYGILLCCLSLSLTLYAPDIRGADMRSIDLCSLNSHTLTECWKINILLCQFNFISVGNLPKQTRFNDDTYINIQPYEQEFKLFIYAQAKVSNATE